MKGQAGDSNSPVVFHRQQVRHFFDDLKHHENYKRTKPVQWITQ